MALTLGRGRRRHQVTVEIYTRTNCGLCDKAEVIVRAEASGADIRLIDIDVDEGLVRRYHIRVPVIVVDGREVAEGQVAEGIVGRAVRRAAKERWADWRRA